MPPAAGAQRDDGRRSCPTCASTSSTAPTTRASSPASIEVRIHPETREAEPGDTDQAHRGRRQRQGRAQDPLRLGRGAGALAPRGGQGRARARRTTCRSTARGSRARSYTIASDDGAGLPGHRRHQGDRRLRRASSATATCPAGRPHLPPALPRPAGAHDDRAVEHRRASAPTTGWRRSQAVTETFTWKLPQDLPPGAVTVTADGLLLAARLLGGRVPEGAGRGVGSRSRSTATHHLHGPRVRRRP